MSDGLSVSLFNREGREVALGLDVTVIRITVPRAGQTVEGPIIAEIVGGKLAVLSPGGHEQPFDLDLYALGGRVAFTLSAPHGPEVSRGGASAAVKKP